ncbi:hypothetical protein XnspCFBP7698_16905 [Xanthomonas sp. CFBP 7698]|nr:hypothetical protein XnspCFBP7698_16905 [Xanthomonas sp. CFBP 7698]
MRATGARASERPRRKRGLGRGAGVGVRVRGEVLTNWMTRGLHPHPHPALSATFSPIKEDNVPSGEGGAGLAAVF